MAESVEFKEEKENDRGDQNDVGNGENGREEANINNQRGDEADDKRGLGRDNDMDKNEKIEGFSVILRNISYKIGSKEIRELASEYGKVTDVYIPQDFYSKQPRGFAFVEFAEQSQAEVAVDKLDGSTLEGRQLRCELAKDRRKNRDEMRRRDDRGGRRDRGYGRGRDYDRRDRDYYRRDRGRDRSRSRHRDRDRDRGRRDRSRSRDRGYARDRGNRDRSRSPPRKRDRSPRRGRSSRSASPNVDMRSVGSK